MEELVQFAADYDLDPQYVDTLPRLFEVLAKIIPSERWETLAQELDTACQEKVRLWKEERDRELALITK